MKTKKKGYRARLILTVILTIAGISTLIPASTASDVCMLGYKAHCTFTPVSTLICLLAAGLICRIRKTKFTED